MKKSRTPMEELKSVLKSARLGDFLLQDHSVREAVDRLGEDLSFAERAELLILFHKYPGTVMYDATSLFKAQILIDDRLFEGETNKPLSYIVFNSQREHTRVEVIDILSSVRKNAEAITHPAIAAAIKHWQQILMSWRYGDAGEGTEAGDVRIDQLGELHEKFRSLAEASLGAIGSALKKGARFQGSSPVASYDRYDRSMKIVGAQNYLHVAWQRLDRRHIDETHELDERIAAIAKHLQSSSAQIDGDQPDLASVLGFLKSAGAKYVYSEESIDSQRPNWDTFREEFVRWFTGLNVWTLQKYKKGRKTLVDRDTDLLSGYFGAVSLTPLWSLMCSGWATPLVQYCPPLKLPPFVTDVRTIRKAILRQKGMKK